MPVKVTKAHRAYATEKFEALDYRDLPEVRSIFALLCATEDALSAAEARAERAEAVRNAKVICPCCDYMTLSETHSYEICPICFWEDDGERDMDEVGGSNQISLRQGRENFAEFGACDRNMLQHVRSPFPIEGAIKAALADAKGKE